MLLFIAFGLYDELIDWRRPERTLQNCSVEDSAATLQGAEETVAEEKTALKEGEVDLNEEDEIDYEVPRADRASFAKRKKGTAFWPTFFPANFNHCAR